MADIEVAELSAELRDGYPVASCTVSGGAQSARFEPEGSTLWHVEATLAPGTELQWHEHHGDEVVYILEGSLEVDGTTCTAETAVIIESDVATSARALSECRLLHFGPVSIEPPTGGRFGPPLESGHRVHVVRPEDARHVNAGTRYYADSTCETCRLSLLHVRMDEPVRGFSHVHTEDEIIRVLAGELCIGPTRVGAGSTVMIPGGRRYSLRTTGPYTFVNYRRDISTVVAAPGTPEQLETVDAMLAARASRAN